MEQKEQEQCCGSLERWLRKKYNVVIEGAITDVGEDDMAW